MKLISFRNAFVILFITLILVLAFCPDIIGTVKQPNGLWMVISANVGILIFINLFDVLYLQSNTVCLSGSDAMTTNGTVKEKGIWVYIRGGNSIRTAGYNTSTGGKQGLEKPGRDFIISLGSHCYPVGGEENSPRRHIMITSHTEQYLPEYCPLELKNIRDQLPKRPDHVFIGFFSSAEIKKFNEYSIDMADGTKKTGNLQSLIQSNLHYDMVLNMYLALLQGNPVFIKDRLEGYNTLLDVPRTNNGLWSRIFPEDREVDENV